MKNRLEYKYLVPLHSIDALRQGLLRYMDYDEYAQKRRDKEYTVRSIYLDSVNFQCYYEKMDGIILRKKFRIRGYNEKADTQHVYFEIKRKYDGFISKDRAAVPILDFKKALTVAHNDVALLEDDKQAFTNFYFYYHKNQLEPKTLVVYDREPFQCRFGSSLRITFDKNLRTKTVSDFDALFDDDGLKRSFHNKFIFEVKFYQVLPQWITTVLNKFELTRIAVSKYTTSVDTQPVSSIIATKAFHREFV
jgi:SPX domain protein involved in polyphosphate accumulation